MTWIQLSNACLDWRLIGRDLTVDICYFLSIPPDEIEGRDV